jgi:hypothetical protein
MLYYTQMAKNKKYLWQRRLKRLKKRRHLLVVPHRNNHYRPHLVRRYGLMAVLVLAIGVQLSYNYMQTGLVLGRITTITPSTLLASTNDARAAEGLSSLRIDARLNEAASRKAKDMLTRGYWSHDAPDGTEPWVWVDQAGYTYDRAGENLAKNFATAGATVEAWLNSPTHRENMLNGRYQDVGFAAVDGELDGKSTTVVVAFYGEPNRGVAGVSTGQSVLAASTNKRLSPAARIGVALQSLTPAAITSLALLFIAATVAVTAHFYRNKLPKNRRESWYKNHGVVKASGLLSMVAFIVLLYGGSGQL